jgi:tryptophan-rich sensory protein
MLRLTSLAGNLVLFIGGCLAANALIFGLGFASSTSQAGDPPGWLVGTAWTLWFALFGVAHWLLGGEGLQFARARLGVELLAILCLLYPLYTMGLSNQVIGLVGNTFTALVTAGLVWWLWPLNRPAALLVLPVIPWLAFASWTILRGQLT